mmetsp:Transcript_11015/g.14383  ORF Transcript_11015/g.14383 Transcript_11015/m.14383 type:complete len:461 (+) Transcript_11015:107-1489(+)
MGRHRHDRPTSTPYPSLNASKPASSIAAVGRCRIQTSGSAEFQNIIDQNIERKRAEEVEKSPEQKKLCKKLMKKSVAECFSWLNSIADVSVIDMEVCVESSMIVNTDGFIVQCLMDAGADAVVLSVNESLSLADIMEILDCARVPRERIVVHFDSFDDVKRMGSLESISVMAAALSIGCNDVPTFLTALAEEATEEVRVAAQIDVVGKSPSSLAEMAGTLSDQCVGCVLNDPSPEQMGLAYAACATTDREDGLFTTIVCARGGEALGLVYSSKESIVAALECGRGVYYSRSRNSLWRKGDTSGCFQVLHRLDLDCDGDALRFTVTQKGEVPAFCHLDTLTCWGKPKGIRHLEETLVQRMKSAPEGSYTKRLFDDSNLLRDKLVEEAQELAEADDSQHVAEELADVLYFAMVRAAKFGVSIDDAAAELDRRARKVTRRQGDSKSFRIAAGEAILNRKKEES